MVTDLHAKCRYATSCILHANSNVDDPSPNNQQKLSIHLSCAHYNQQMGKTMTCPTLFTQYIQNKHTYDHWCDITTINYVYRILADVAQMTINDGCLRTFVHMSWATSDFPVANNSKLLH